MGDGGAAHARLPAQVSPYGPFDAWGREVHGIAQYGSAEQALAAADRYASLAALLGDERTLEFLVQGRMYARQRLGRYPEALADGQELLARHQAAGNPLGEAKVLADLADLYFLLGRFGEGMRCLARAGLLLETPRSPLNRYLSALSNYAIAAESAELYEAAHDAYERVRQGGAVVRLAWLPSVGNHPKMLNVWALRLAQLGRTGESTRLFQRVITLTATTAVDPEDLEEVELSRDVSAFRAVALAMLGDVDEAIALAQPLVAPPVSREVSARWWAHLALGIAHRARGDRAAARRELLASQQFSWDEPHESVLLIEYELAALAVDSFGDAGRPVLDVVRRQAERLWQQRLNYRSMLQQARQREELEIERTATAAALLRDPLTGLGNRRQFDQIAVAVDTGAAVSPVSLLVVDVDNFKTINDTHSHNAGDHVLRELGAIFRAHCRAGQDTPIRYAGDEFVVFLHANLATAVEIAERIRSSVAATDFDSVTPGTRVSISTGVATLRRDMTAADLFIAADAHLYRAKRAGRNRVAA